MPNPVLVIGGGIAGIRAPPDLASRIGVYLVARAKWVDESIAQACVAAARATTILSKETLEMEGIVAKVNEDLCRGCRVCEYLCPYGAVEMREKDGESVSRVLEALCKGCGACGTACPTKAIMMGHFTTDGIYAQVRATLLETKA